jgi:hypothetical protein
MATKKVSPKAVFSEFTTLAKVAAGMVGGTLAVNAANKLLKVDETSPLPKRMIAPAVVMAGGAILAMKSKNPMVKSVAAGAGAAGAVRIMRALAPNSRLLQGLGAPEDEYMGSLSPTSAIAQNEDWVYRDTSGHLAFPDLGEIEPPARTGGYYLDAPAYMGAVEDTTLLGANDYAEML